ncbi:hypothetical protein V8E55_003832 [Tylopilus felleus]
MSLQNDMIEMKNMMVQNRATQIQTLENLRMTFGTGQRHRMLLEQCQSLDQLEFMLRANLSQCEAQAVEAQRRYIDKNQYEFVVDDVGNEDRYYRRNGRGHCHSVIRLSMWKAVYH